MAEKSKVSPTFQIGGAKWKGGPDPLELLLPDQTCPVVDVLFMSTSLLPGNPLRLMLAQAVIGLMDSPCELNNGPACLVASCRVQLPPLQTSAHIEMLWIRSLGADRGVGVSSGSRCLYLRQKLALCMLSHGNVRRTSTRLFAWTARMSNTWQLSLLLACWKPSGPLA
jgi:hypothetical protein